MEQGTRKGYLSCFIKDSNQEKHWQSRYYIFHGSKSGGQPRLDFYDSEKKFIENGNIHGTMYIGDIHKIRKGTATKEMKFVFEVVLKDDNVRVFATDSEKELLGWIECLRSEKEKRDSTCIMPPGMVNLRGSHNSLDREESYDENVLYESAANPDVFDVEVIESKASLRNHLDGAYRLFVHSQNMTLCQTNTTQQVLVWPYRYIRRYGRSKTTFTFEAGRKCNSGEGYFTFKVENGDDIFGSVQKRTKEMKKQVSPSVSLTGTTTGGATKKPSSPSDVSPALPVRKYLPEEEADSENVTSKVHLFEQKGTGDPQARPKPPLLQKRSKPPVPPNKPCPVVMVGAKRKGSLDATSPTAEKPERITQGYELAKTISVGSPLNTPYEDTERVTKKLDVNYKETDFGKNDSTGIKGTESHVYALYDVTRSSRAIYDDPADSYYHSAETVKIKDTASGDQEYAEAYISTSGNAWRKQCFEKDNIHIENYEPTTIRGDLECDGEDIYEEPDETGAGVIPESKIIDISNRLKAHTLNNNDTEDQYDHINVRKAPVPKGGGRPLPSVPTDNNSEYGQLLAIEKDKVKNKKKNKLK